MGDGPPRAAVRRAILDSTGHDPGCSSGWVEEEEAEALRQTSHEATAKWLEAREGSPE